MKAIKRSICAIVVAVVVGLATAASAQGQAVQRVAPVDATQTVVFETPGLLRVTTGSACGESNRSGTEPTIEIGGRGRVAVDCDGGQRALERLENSSISKATTVSP